MGTARTSHGAVTARANANVALVKYWGKRDATLNLPATGSISLTLAGLAVEADVAFGDGARDEVLVDGAAPPADERARVTAFLDVVRAETGCTGVATVRTRSTVPRGAGLASSAAAFAALAVAAVRAAGAERSDAALSALARRGSGSAARSIFGGFVEWVRGDATDGSDSVAQPLVAVDAWDVRMVVAVVDTAPKAVSSRDGMMRAMRSPLYPAWLDTTPRDLDVARAAIAARDLDTLGEVAEHSALKMHAIGLAARPPLLYWHGATVECLRRVWELRAGGTPAWVTIDAGPQVKVLTTPAAAPRVAEALAAVPGVERVVTCAPGGGAEVLA
jgi:diphosphomevalonate decarboxylase